MLLLGGTYARALVMRLGAVARTATPLYAAPPLLELFEALINAVHEHAPRARICFNTTPRDSEAAVRRWARPRD